MKAVDFYKRNGNGDNIPECDNIKCWSPDQLIWFAEAYHQIRVNEISKEMKEGVDKNIANKEYSKEYWKGYYECYIDYKTIITK